MSKQNRDTWIADLDLDQAVLGVRFDPSERSSGEFSLDSIIIKENPPKNEGLPDIEGASSDLTELARSISSSDVFCVAPFIQTVVTATGEMHPCCSFNGQGSTSVNDREPTKIWNAHEFVDLRRKLVVGEPPIECRACYDREKHNIVSIRNIINHHWDTVRWGNPNGETSADLAAAASGNAFEVPAGPSWIELNLGNLCNLKCRMCNGNSSSSIASDPVQSHWTTPNSWSHPRWQSSTLSILPRRISGIDYVGFSDLAWTGSSAVTWIDKVAEVKLSHVRRDVSALTFHLVGDGTPAGEVVAFLNDVEIFRSVSLAGGKQARWDLSESQKAADELVLRLECEGVVGVTNLDLIREGRLNDARETNRFASGKKWFRDEEFFGREIFELGPNVTKLEFKGGEPLLIKEVRPLLENLVARGVAGDLELVIVTSGTITSGPVFDLLPHFKGISMIISLDGAGPLNDYIRFGSCWEEVTANIPKFMALPNTFLSINTTVQAYNMFHIADIAEYAVRMKIGMSCNFLADPNYLSYFAMPPKAVAAARARLQNFIETSSLRKSEEFERIKSVLTDVVAGLKDENSSYNSTLLHKFFQYTEDLDRSRGQAFKAVNSELLDFIEAERVGANSHGR